MKKFFRNARYRYGVIFCVISMLLFIVLALIYTNRRREEISLAETRVSFIAKNTAERIMEWKAERLADVSMLTMSRLFSQAVCDYLNSGNPVLYDAIFSRLASIARQKDFSEAILCNAAGNRVLSINNALAVPEPRLLKIMQQWDSSSATYFAGFGPAVAGMDIDFVVPLFNPAARSKRPDAFICISVDPEKYLYPIIEHWPVPTSTSEIILIRNDGDSLIALSRLRYSAAEPGLFTFPHQQGKSLPARQAAAGKQGLVTGADYRGEKVIAYVTPIAGTPWLLIVKSDLAEVLQEMNSFLALCIIILFTGVGFTGSMLLILYRAGIKLETAQKEQFRREKDALERHYSSLLQYANDLIILADEQQRISACNYRTLTVLGFTKQELEGENCSVILARTPLDFIKKVSMLRTHGEDGFIYETEAVCKSGARFPLEVSCRAITIENQKFYQLIGRDITERKRADEAIRQKSEQLEIITDNMQDLVVQLTAAGIFVYVSPSHKQVLGYTPAELLGTEAASYVHREDVARLLVLFRQDQKAAPAELLFRVKHKKGHYVWLETSVKRLRDENGAFAGVVLGSRDVTEKKLSVDRMHRLQRMYTVLSLTNQTIVRIEDRDSLYKRFVSVATETGGLRLAWIGMYDDHSSTLTTAAWAGVSEGYIEHMVFSSVLSAEQGIIERVFLSGKPYVCNNTATDPLVARWRERSLQRKYLARAAFPIILFGKTKGVFELYADTANFFDQDEVNLISELAQDISFGLEFLERENMRSNALNALKESERRFRAIMEEMQLFSLMLDREGRITFCNKFLLFKTGYSAEEVIGKNWFALFTDPAADIGAIFAEHIRYNTIPANYVNDVMTRRSGKLTVQWNNILLKDAAGRAVGIASIGEDITARLLAEEALKESQEKYRNFFDADLSGAFITSAEGPLLDCNDAFLRVTGFTSKEQAIGYNIGLLYAHPPDRANYINEISTKGSVHNRIIYLKRVDNGKVLRLLTSAIGTFDEQGRLKSLQGYIQDDTDRWNAEREVLLHKEIVDSLLKLNQLEHLAEDEMAEFGLSEMARLTESKNCCLCVPKNGVKRWFFTQEDGTVLRFTGDTMPGQPGPAELLLHAVTAQGPLLNNNAATLAGTSTVSRFMAVPVTGGSEPSLLCAVANRDIAYDNDDLQQLKLYMEQLWQLLLRKRSRDELFRLLLAVDQNPTSIVITDTSGNIEYVNRKFTEISGYEAADVLGKNPRVLKSGETTMREYQELWATISTGGTWRGELHNRHKNGSLYWEYAVISPVKNTAGEIISYLAIKEDISGRKQLEAMHKKSELQFRSVWQSSFDGMRLTDENGRVVMVNEAYCRLVEIPAAELIGAEFTLVYEEPYRASSLRKYRDNYRHGSVDVNLERQVTFWNGKTKWLELTNSLVDIGGQGTLLLSVFRDITGRKESELAVVEAKERAEEMNRLKSTFLANMSHELRTPLIGILGFAEILESEIEAQEHREMLHTIQSSGERLLETLNLILDLSKIEADRVTANPVWFNPEDEIRDLIKTVRATALRKGIGVELRDTTQPLAINVDKIMFRSVVSNLLGNAVKFTVSGGVVVDIATTPAAEGQGVQITITDTGIGIPKDSLGVIFDEFRQVSEGYSRQFEGTGLGLAITKRFMQKMGGTIAVSSTVGKGSCFTLSFPCTIMEDTSEQAAGDAAFRLLFVDDDATSRNLIGGHLLHYYRVDTAGSSTDALTQINQLHYDVILLDIQLGEGKSGLELMRIIRRLPGYAATPIIAVTAFAVSGDEDRLLQEGFDEFLAKPFPLKLLREKIAAALERRRQSS